MPEPTSPPPPPDPLADSAEAARADHLREAAADSARAAARKLDPRIIARRALRASRTGLIVAGFLPTLLIMAAWVSGTTSRLSPTAELDTPLGRDPVRWRADLYLHYFPLEVACPLGFAVGFLIRCAVEWARYSPRLWTIAGVLAAAYVGTTGVLWHSALPEAPDWSGSRERYDPIEDDPTVRPMLRAAEREAEVKLKDVPKMLMGNVHGYWGLKKAILKEKYEIDWRSPAELNPHIAYD